MRNRINRDEEVRMNRVQRTCDLFTNGGLNCAQAILTVYGETQGMDQDVARRLGRPLGGGVGISGEICGLLIAGVQVLAYAFNDPDEKMARKNTQHKVFELLDKFHEKHGAMTCNGLLGVQRSTAKGELRIKKEGLIQRRCHAFCRDAAEILEVLLTDSS
jgi:C_GCAxxG_C_C family probable redox protein